MPQKNTRGNDLYDAYCAGRAAYFGSMSHLSKPQCPFEDKGLAESWQEGYDEAMYEDE